MSISELIRQVRLHVANMRAYERRLESGTVVVSWKDAGEVLTAFGCCRDMSDAGMGVECPEPFPCGRTVRLRTRAMEFSRSAAVRYCRKSNGAYLVGFEFVPESGPCPILSMSELDLALDGVNW